MNTLQGKKIQIRDALKWPKQNSFQNSSHLGPVVTRAEACITAMYSNRRATRFHGPGERGVSYVVQGGRCFVNYYNVIIINCHHNKSPSHPCQLTLKESTRTTQSNTGFQILSSGIFPFWKKKAHSGIWPHLSQSINDETEASLTQERSTLGSNWDLSMCTEYSILGTVQNWT